MRKEKVDLSNQLEEERRYVPGPAEPSEKGEGEKKGVLGVMTA